ncbi:MAG: hypothetical protein L3K08_00185 [Thermoplasmata archaeon]|nr:hypothetical protein [Thermoplasmata archaeon]
MPDPPPAIPAASEVVPALRSWIQLALDLLALRFVLGMWVKRFGSFQQTRPPSGAPPPLRAIHPCSSTSPSPRRSSARRG